MVRIVNGQIVHDGGSQPPPRRGGGPAGFASLDSLRRQQEERQGARADEHFGGDSTAFIGRGGSDGAGRDLEAATVAEQQRELAEHMADPVWGETVRAGQPLRPHYVCCAAACPCAGVGAGGCLTPQKTAVWRRLARRPVLLLSAAQLLLLCLALRTGGLLPWKENMLLGPPDAALVQLGAVDGLPRLAHQPWRVLSALLLHGGALQAVFNVYLGLRLLLPLEQRWGARTLLVVWLLAGTGGVLHGICSQSPDKIYPMAAASVPTYGVLAAWLTETLCLWDAPELFSSDAQRVTALALPFSASLMGLVQTLQPVVAGLGAHAVAAALGVLLGLAHFYSPPAPPQTLTVPLAARVKQRLPLLAAVGTAGALLLLLGRFALRVWLS